VAAHNGRARALNRALREENEELLRTLGCDQPQTIDEWEQLLPQHVRDALAARALIASNGDPFRAAARLGFGHLHRPQAVEILQRIFTTPGVKEILARDLREPEETRAELIARQVQIALYGDDSTSVKSFTVLAKMCGWIQAPDVLVQNNRQTILALVTQKNSRGQIPSESLEVLPSFLEHEPGAAVRIDSGDLVAAVVGEDE
jgi:hypothetical protein